MSAVPCPATSAAMPLIAPLFGDAIAPTAFFLPGFLFMALGTAVPATVLAGVLERPFVTRAGVKRNALAYSLQANLVSAVLGILCTPLALFLIYTVGPLWSLLAVMISIYSEGLYYRTFALDFGQKLQWRWIVLANIFSSAILFALAPILIHLEERYPNTYWRAVQKVEHCHGWIFWGSLVASLVIFFWSFVVTGRERRRRSLAMTLPFPAVHMAKAQQDAPPATGRSEAAAPSRAVASSPAPE